jgi:hypothetical protein
MLYKKFREKISRSNQLSAVDTLGSFDFWTCLISLDSLVARDLEVLSGEGGEAGSRSDDTVLQFRRILPLAVHEYTHFLDTTSTVWGIDHLSMMNAAYLCDDRRGGDETSFYMAKRFSDHLKRIKYPDYYTVVTNVNDQRPWRAQPSIGQIFGNDGVLSDETILFLRFSTYSDDFIARSPISPVSILEASAMSQEMLLEARLLREHSPDYMRIESASFTQRLMSLLYNKKVTEYSACVHMLANQQECKDAAKAFTLLAYITRIVLNSTDKVFERIIAENRVGEILGYPKHDQKLAPLKQGLKYRNLGVLYYLIVSALPKNSYSSENSVHAGVKAAVNKLGVDLDFIKQSASEHICNALEGISEISIGSIAKLAEAGKMNFDIVGVSIISLPFHSLSIPRVMLGDMSEAYVFPTKYNMLSDFDIEACFKELTNGESWVKRFSEGCV